MYDPNEKARKLREDSIYIKDLPEYMQKKAIPNTKVHILKLGKWTLIGNTWILVKSFDNNLEDAWAYIVTRKNKPFWNWAILPIAKMCDKGTAVMDWQEIETTKIILDFWYIGDGTGGNPIAFLSKEHERPVA